MKLEIGDVIEFKKYEDMTKDETAYIAGNFFPKSGKIAEIKNSGFFTIENCGFVFNPKSVKRVISNANRFNPGDEVLAKVTVKKAFRNYLQINSSIEITDVVKILKRKGPERFIIQEKHYGFYIGVSGDLVSDKDRAQIYTSREDANDDAADMYLSKWEVIPYGN